VLTDGRNAARFEKTAPVTAASVAGQLLFVQKEAKMIKIANAQLWVHDQDEALAFYTQKLGWEVRADVTLPELGNFRWLTVGPAEQPDVAVVLMAIPGPPVMDAETDEQVRRLMAKGCAGTVFLTTDDCHASYEELKGRGVEFTEPPEDRPYGIDSGFRDPSGNSLRLTQVRDLAAI
jgi:predicted enzyme related to lactoylglutathione lyase